MLPFILALTVLTTASDVNRYIASRQTNDVSFVLTGHVQTRSGTKSVDEIDFTVSDATGITQLRLAGCPAPKTGDIVVARGRSVTDFTKAKTFLATSVTVTGFAPLPPPIDFEISATNRPDLNFRVVRTHGNVVDAFHDEIDPNNDFLILRSGNTLFCASLATSDDIGKYIGCDVRITGSYTGNFLGRRIISGQIIHVTDASRVEILRTPAVNRFDAPSLDYLLHVRPEDIVRMGRHRVEGRVLAVWGGERCLVRTADGRSVQADLSSFAAHPACGDMVQVVGFPDTDLFGVNLINAELRRLPDQPCDASEPQEVTTSALFLDDRQQRRVNVAFRGRAIRIRGIVRDLPPANGRFNLRCGEFTLPVDISANPACLNRLQSGAEIEVTGCCIVETDSWRPNVILPHVRGLVLVTRSPDDIRVLTNPPWWTPARLLVAIGILILAMIGFFIRLRIQKRIAALRFGERTRLAVELHDSLSQNLEGLACQIAATKGVFETDRPLAARCLDTAEHMLDSCRIELRRCLFDLRGTALEEANLSDAIRKTLEPILPDTVQTAIRFNVSRAHFDDSTVHAILCIIRELVSNALRHGQATHIRIAGEYHDGTLSFSVRDNGCGFNPAACAGPGEGHFGLTGIRERIDRLSGTFVITSTPGRGTRVKATIASDPHRTESHS